MLCCGLFSFPLLLASVLAQASDDNLETAQVVASNSGNGSSGPPKPVPEAKVLEPGAIQIASLFTGLDSLGADRNVQAESKKSDNNFINFCLNQKRLTNGHQIPQGSCNGIPMGQLPAQDKMISTVILAPKNGQVIQSGEDFEIILLVLNLRAGSFTNPVATFYGAPQSVEGGLVVGHSHVVIQEMGDNRQPPDPARFAFFKGINDEGDSRGKLRTTVEGGLGPGSYRLCTMNSASNHQPVVMPVAQRGSQDDCIRFTVSGDPVEANDAASDGVKGQAAVALAASAVELGPGALTASNGQVSTSTIAPIASQSEELGVGVSSNPAAATTAAPRNAGNNEPVFGNGPGPVSTTTALQDERSTGTGGEGEGSQEECRTGRGKGKGGRRCRQDNGRGKKQRTRTRTRRRTVLVT